MVVNGTNCENQNVKFVSYTGSFPNLCSGILTLEIDGVEVKFGSSWKGEVDYPKFWVSGGGLDSDYCAFCGEWVIDARDLPEQYRKYAVEIDRVFNENVEWGCCGGCA